MRGFVHANSLVRRGNTRNALASLIDQLTGAHRAIQPVGLESNWPRSTPEMRPTGNASAGIGPPDEPVVMAH